MIDMDAASKPPVPMVCYSYTRVGTEGDPVSV
jgi:hypothetical protein